MALSQGSGKPLSLALRNTLDKGDQDAVWVEDNQLSRSPGCISHHRIGRKQSFGLILLVERLNTGHLEAARTIFGQGPVRAEPHMELHAISCDNGILNILMEDLEAQLPKEAGRLTEIGCVENRDRTGQ